DRVPSGRQTLELAAYDDPRSELHEPDLADDLALLVLEARGGVRSAGKGRALRCAVPCTDQERARGCCAGESASSHETSGKGAHPFNKRRRRRFTHARAGLTSLNRAGSLSPGRTRRTRRAPAANTAAPCPPTIRTRSRSRTARRSAASRRSDGRRRPRS